MSSDASRDLARFFQDWAGLWREEILAQANDPAAQEAWQVMAAQWANAAAAACHDPTSPLYPPWPPPWASHLRPAWDPAGTRHDGATAGPQAASVASEPLDGAIERLTGRIDALEARIAALEPSAVRQGRRRR